MQLGRRDMSGPAEARADLLNIRISRRSLVGRASTAMLVGGVLHFASGCSALTFGPNTPEPDEAAETPASVPDSPTTPVPINTPIPAPTPPPEPEPTPTPEPPEQILRMSGTMLDGAEDVVRDLPECVRNGMTTAGLLRLTDEFALEPDWAESWEPLEERDGWRFQIRPNEDGWGDGVPVTAHDFVEHWRSLLHPETGSQSASLLLDIEFAAGYRHGEVSAEGVGIAAIDDWTLEVYLDRHRETFPVVVTSPALRPRVPAGTEADDRCAGIGRYRVEPLNDSSVELVPREGYWDETPFGLERIELTAAPPALALTEFQQQAVDIVRLRSTDVARVREDPAMRNSIVSGSPWRTIMLVPDVTVPPFDSVGIRRALSYLIDRRRLEQIAGGLVIPATRLFPAGLFPALDDASAGITAGLDVDAALEEIAATEYSDPLAWPQFGLDIPSGDGYLDRVARDVATQLRENLGIQVPIRVHDAAEYAIGLQERQYPLAWFDWTYPYADPASGYADLFAGWRDTSGPISWSHSEYDELLYAADALPSDQARASAYAGCEGLLQEHGACIPLVHPVSFYLVQRWVEGLPRDGRSRLLTGETLGASFARTISVGERSE